MQLTVLSSGSKGNCYILESSTGERLILEAGVNFNEVKKAINFEVNTVVGCLQSHIHLDHFKYVRDFLRAGINCYTTPETIEKSAIKHHRLYSMETKKTYHIGSFKVIAFHAIHDCECYGFLINHVECGNLLFVTDSSYIPHKFPGLNNILIEANYSLEKVMNDTYKDSTKNFLTKRVIESHMSDKTCCEVLQANDLTAVNNIVLIHLSDRNSDAIKFKQTVSDLTGKTVHIADKGLSINFSKYPF